LSTASNSYFEPLLAHFNKLMEAFQEEKEEM